MLTEQEGRGRRGREATQVLVARGGRGGLAQTGHETGRKASVPAKMFKRGVEIFQLYFDDTFKLSMGSTGEKMIVSVCFLYKF